LDCHCVSVSYRGRGQSDTPAKGYDLEHHLSDFQAVVEALDLKPFGLMAFSRGVGYACGYAKKYPEMVKGMLLVDHPPIHVQPGPGYAQFWKELVYLGFPITKHMRPEALDRLEAEAKEQVFWEELSRFDFPITNCVGTSKLSKIPSELTEEDLQKYRKYVKDYRQVNFEYSGHMVVDEELGKYRLAAQEFYEQLCNGESKGGIQ
ncbi:MAG: alpha/beta hydrolase, partial [bacterium]|nr:alpha/beta hydrolase [bacterium]